MSQGCTCCLACKVPMRLMYEVITAQLRTRIYACRICHTMIFRHYDLRDKRYIPAHVVTPAGTIIAV